MKIEWMQACHLPQVFHIENISFDEPWKPRDFYALSRDPNTLLWVALDDEGIYSYPVMAHATWQVLPDAFYINGLAVHPACRRKKVGTRIMREIFRKAAEINAIAESIGSVERNIMTAVEEQNLKAQLFFKSFDPLLTRLERNCFCIEDDMIDGYHFEWEPKNDGSRSRKSLFVG